jgi:imidazolonepropionase-like amidohydrolase
LGYLACVSLWGVLALATPASPATRPAGRPYVITNVAVIDVEKGTAVERRAVTVMGDRIERIRAQAEAGVLETAEIIDGQGLYLIPGLSDAHVHYFDAPVFGRLMIANGVLLVRDTGMPNEYILKLRDQLNRGESLGPEMIATGAMLDGDPPIIPPIAVGIKTPEEGRAAVRRQAQAGANMIKVYSRLDRESFLAIVQEARAHGLKVVAHLPESVYLEDAAAAGLGSSEHFNGFEKVIAKLLGEPVNLSFAGQASQAGYLQRLDQVKADDLRGVYRRLRASGLTVCPTVVTFKTMTHGTTFQSDGFPGSEYISRSVRDLWKTLWSQQSDLPDFIWRKWAQMVNGLSEAGVPLMVGTDLMLPGVIPGYSVHEEMVIWQEAGIPPAQVLRSATLVPARFLGLEHRLGAIVEGRTASMVLLRANPLQDIRNAQKVEGVFLRGRYFRRVDLDRLLQEAKELARDGRSPQG